MTGQFYGKVALATGGGSGIGRTTSMMFAREGARVVVSDINAKGGEETVSLIKAACGEAVFIHADVSKASDVEAMVDKTVETYGRLDYGFNNAGVLASKIPGAIAPTHEYPEDIWDLFIAVHLKGVWLCMKYEIPQMLEQGSGAVVNVSSASGLVGGANSSAYHAAKHGIVGLTKTAALEYAKQGIRVNAVCPGFIQSPTDGNRFADNPEMLSMLLAMHPIGRVGRPEEIAEAALWLCSDAASFVTGHAMAVDGGYVAQ